MPRRQDGLLSSRNQGGRRRLLAPFAFPAAVAVVVAVLGLLGLTGSSLGLYASSNGADEAEAGVLSGPSRPIRTDEWLVRTPWVLRQVEHGLPNRLTGGMGTHDAALVYDLPTRGWEVLLRPQTAGYRFLDAERAFAIEWWAFFAIQLLGIYALLLVLTGRIAVSALAASLVTLSPATHWWTTPATFTTVGYGSLATALVLAAYRARTHRGRLLLSALAGLALAAFLAALYPPWQIGVALLLVPIGVSTLLADLRASVDRRRALRSLALVLPTALGIGGGLFGAFLVTHGGAIEAISDTVYPGRRTASVGGGTASSVVLSSTYDSFASEKPFSMVNGTNQSENSSALPLLLPVGVASLALLLGRRLQRSRTSSALLGSLAGGGLISAWMLLPIPAAAGRLLLLTRAPPSRMLLPVGLAGVIALALLTSHMRETGSRLAPWQLLASTGAFGGALAWGAAQYTVDGVGIDPARAALLALAPLAGLALCLCRRPIPGLMVLALFGLWQASLVNPVQDGMGALTDSPLRRAIDVVRRGGQGDEGWIALSADTTVRGTLTASGVNNLAGVSPYPDRTQWRILDPGLDNEEAWNRYAHVSFTVAAPGAAPSFTLLGPDNLSVAVDPCAPALRSLGVRFLVTQGFEIGSCVRPVAKVPYGSSYVVVYRY